MDCPSCKNPMIVLELDNVEIDYSPDCGGIWLDAGELEQLLSGTNKKEELMSSLKPACELKEKTTKCPICSKRMEKIYIGKKEKVVVDKCRFAHGIWFDKGELRQVIVEGEVDGTNKISELLKNMFGEK